MGSAAPPTRSAGAPCAPVPARIGAPAGGPLKDRPADPTTEAMIEPTAASPAATGAGGAAFAAAGARAPARATTRSFAGELARFAAASSTATSTATPAPQRPDGEQTRKVAGHPYARIENGADRGRYLNQLAGSPRLGQDFRLVERDDRVFHVYGSGTDKLVVEIRRGRTA